MDKQSVKAIKEVIEHFLELRKYELDKVQEKEDGIRKSLYLSSKYGTNKKDFEPTWEYFTELKNYDIDKIRKIEVNNNINLDNVLKEREEIYKKYNVSLIKLNTILESKEKYNEVLEIEKEMTKIQAKKIITVKEFKEIYGYSPEWQKNRRSRINSALPYIQTVEGGKVTYNVKEVNNWFENENIVF